MSQHLRDFGKWLLHLAGLAAEGVLVVFVPWKTNHYSLHSLLNNPSQQEERMAIWRQEKLGELSFVGVACALVAGVAATSLSWPRNPEDSWLSPALWYGSVIMSLTAISSASQQTLSLHRLHCYKDGLARLRNMLGEQSSKDSNKWIVRPVQLFVWQIPVMLLNFSVLLYLSGLVKLLEARATAQSWSVSSSDTKVCAVAGVIAAISFVNYIFGASCLYYQTYAHFSS